MAEKDNDLRLLAVERMATVNQTNIANIGQTLIRIEDWMRDTSRDRQENHEMVIQDLSTIKANVIEFKKYQEKCDFERESMSDDVLDLKLKQSNQAGKASVWAIVAATITSGSIAVLSSIYERLK